MTCHAGNPMLLPGPFARARLTTNPSERAVCGTISISVPTSTFVSISKLLSPNGGSYAEQYLDNVYVHTHTYVLTYMHCVYYTSLLRLLSSHPSLSQMHANAYACTTHAHIRARTRALGVLHISALVALRTSLSVTYNIKGARRG